MSDICLDVSVKPFEKSQRGRKRPIEKADEHLKHI